MKSWREVAHPHPDVLEGTFQQAEFAADITAVRTGKATREYQDATAFFQRTFITEGMRLLLTSVAKRLNGQGGDPVIQLQTAFGGGKTHTMLAVYHLATRTCAIKDLVGVPLLLDQAGLMDVPNSRVAVLDGTNLSNAVLEDAFAFNTKFTNVVIEGADFTNVPLRGDALKTLCAVASGTNPVTGRDTRSTLDCS